MSYKQVLTPNLDTDPNHPLYIYIGGSILTDWCGWCLAVVAGSYGAKGSSYSAKTAWQSCQNKHCDRNIPEGVWTPLWYGGGEYGHVVIGKRSGGNITVYSSPYTHKPSFEVFSGELNYILDYIGRVYGVGSFSGWSENVLDSRVIEKKTEQKPNKPEPTPEPEPEPDPVEDDNKEKDDNMTTPEPVKEVDQQLVGGILEEAGDNSEWIPSKQAKLIAYLVGDTLLGLAIIAPDVINCIQAPTLSIFGEYLAKVLLETGTFILMVFKLIKKKS